MKFSVQELELGPNTTRIYRRYIVIGKLDQVYRTKEEANKALKHYNTKIQVMSAMLVIFMLSTIVCLGLLVFTSKKEMENRGCIASAYQATKYGHDLEANLAACHE